MKKIHVKLFLIVSILVTSICCFVNGITLNLAWTKYIGIVSSVMTVISLLYIKWIWKFCPWEKTPRLATKYKGEIHYTYGDGGIKNAEILIQQNLFSAHVRIKTDEITSDTITSSIIEENGSWFLYYCYITNPQAKYSKNNPIQRGTARLEILMPEYDLKTGFLKYKYPVNFLTGTYWTTRETTGDIVLKMEPEQ